MQEKSRPAKEPVGWGAGAGDARWELVERDVGRPISALGKQSQIGDLLEDAVAAEGLHDQSDAEAEHGDASVETLGTLQLFVTDLAGGGVEKPGVIGLRGASHGKESVTATKY